MSFQLLTVLVAAAGMAMVGITYGAAAAYFMCAVLGALMVVSYISARLSGRALSARRQVNDHVFDGDMFGASVELTNHGRLPLFVLKVSETISPWLVADTDVSFIVAALRPGETVRFLYRLRARKRGVHTIGPLHVTVSDPFGLFCRRIALQTLSEAVIYPAPIPLTGGAANTGLEAHPVATGERARGAESGMEFHGIRDYQPGDELRRIHWPATAHHATLTVIEFDQGVSENLAVVLDTMAGTEFGSGVHTTLEVAVQAAASLARWTLEGDGIFFLANHSAAGPQWLEVDRLDREHEVLEALARVNSDGAQPVASVAEWATPLLPPGASVCIITAAPDLPLAGAVEHLRYAAAASAVAVIALDPGSFDPSARRLSRGLPSLTPEELARALAPAGGALVALRRDHDLREALEGVISASP